MRRPASYLFFYTAHILIKQLYIKNYALIDELEVSFGAGLNVLTGETGAGKSIIIGALNAVLGERADTETIRQGAEKAIVEAVLSADDKADSVVAEIFRKNDIDWNKQEIILRREIRPAGSRAFINDSPVTLSVMQSVGDRLVDLHGQHQHQLLLKQEHHREVVDTLPNVQPLKENYRSAYSAYRDLFHQLEKIKKEEQELMDKREWNRYQLKELESADLDPEAFEKLEAEMKRLDHAEELSQKSGAILELGSEGDNNIMDALSVIEDALRDIIKIEPEFSSYLEELQSAGVSLQELLSYTERFRSEIEFNPSRLEELRQNQATIRRLEKKYHRSLPELIEYRNELREAANVTENFDLILEKKEKEVKTARKQVEICATELHDARKKAASEQDIQIVSALKSLGMPFGCFETKVDLRKEEKSPFEVGGERTLCQPDGPDVVAFYLSTNKGEALRPLARIASGGEISRVMLAMKSVMAKEQKLPVMIFDEIDSGISGSVAGMVGKKMYELADQCQIIAITHLPQIAMQAEQHYKVIKEETDGRSTTQILKLDKKQQIEEIASLMSGSDLSKHVVAGVREMVSKKRSRRT